MVSTALSTSYLTLKNKVKKTLLLGQQRIEREKVRTYWETGKIISDHLTKYSNRSEHYGGEVVGKLATDLEISETVLRRCIRFSETFKIQASRLESLPDLSWSHYRTLMTITDDSKRKELLKRTIQSEWTAETLEKEIKKIHVARELSDETNTKLPELLKASRGSLYTYRLRLDEIVHSAEPALRVDLGFSCYQEINIKGFKEGDIVATERGLSLTPKAAGTDPHDSYILKKSSKTIADLFTFIAYIERVIDGDTLIAQVDLGFSFWTRQTLRLRGIDAPEIDTPEGKRAKKFVEQELAAVPYVIISSTKSDKYDRYLADVFYQPSASAGHPRAGGDPEKFLNNELLAKRLAVRA